MVRLLYLTQYQELNHNLKLYGFRQTSTVFLELYSSIKWIVWELISIELWHKIKQRLGSNPVVVQLPIGAEEEFKGVIDIIKMKAIHWDEENKGMTFKYMNIPEELKAECEEYRALVVEAAAEASEDLMSKYLEGEEFSEQEIKSALRHLTVTNKIVPVFCGSAFKIKGYKLF